VEGRVRVQTRPVRPQALPVGALEHRVPVLTAVLGEDGELMRAAGATADGLVIAAFGAGHLTPGMLAALREIGDRIPVLITVRPERGSMLRATYGFEGSERDVRATAAVCVPLLSAPAARVALLCCLGAGLDRNRIAAALALFDA
ncbi:MAG: hypothetical protein WBQ18_09265, partial [Solirubrobacteraceae bacterium]